MSIVKLITTDSYDFGDPSTSLVPVHRRGVDSNWMTKTASQSDLAKAISEVKPIAGKTIIHVIALGDEERYGANRNGDAFSRKDNVTAHKTFKDIGTVFKHHKHNDPSLSVGDVLATSHNDLMDRIELLLALDNKKCEKEVNALNSGKDVPLSMGSSQEYDICSVCGHKAPEAKDHCEHVKNNLGEVLKDGSVVYMKNPNPKYFDISLVWKPADRIAYTLKKVASASRVIGGHELAKEAGLVYPSFTKVATKQAIAEIIKQVPLSVRKAATPNCVHEDTIKKLASACKAYGTNQVLANLTKRGFMLCPKDFASVIGVDNPELAESADKVHEGIDDILDDHTEVDLFKEPSVEEDIPLDEGVIGDLCQNCQMSEEPVRKRVMSVTIIKPATMKVAASTVEGHGLAMLYKHYKVAFAHKHRDNPKIFGSVASTF
jgi:hypothetical protein